MKTAPEILLEPATARRQHAAAEKQWADLVSQCRRQRWQAPFGYQSAAFLVLLAYFGFTSQPGDYRGVVIVTGIFLLYCLPAYVVSQRRREKALLTIVAQEAPQLHRKLQQAGIA